MLNVAITRAKNCFIIIGDLDYIKCYQGLLKDLTTYIESLAHRIEIINIKNIFNVYRIVFKKEYPKPWQAAVQRVF